MSNSRRGPAAWLRAASRVPATLLVLVLLACSPQAAPIPTPPAAPPAAENVPLSPPLASLQPPADSAIPPALPVPAPPPAGAAAPARLDLAFVTPTPTPRRASASGASKGGDCPRQTEWSPSQPWDDVWYADPNQSRVAITFDTGQGTPVVLRILDILQEKQVHATFFMMGSWVEKNQEVAQRIVARGHNIGNHSYSHPDFRNLSDERMDWELEATENAVLAATGCSTRPFLRAPFGSTDNRIRARHVTLGYRDIMWTIDSGDWRGFSAATMQEIILSRARAGAILIFHSSVPESALALPGVIDGLRAQGFALVTLTELFQTPPPKGPTPTAAPRLGQ